MHQWSSLTASVILIHSLPLSHSTDMCVLQSLLTMPKYALEQIPKAVLKDFCLRHDLAAGCNGKREGDVIKKDYIDTCVGEAQQRPGTI